MDELAVIIGAPGDLLPGYGQPKWDANPYIEVDSQGSMIYIISERGQEYQRNVTDKMEDLLYWIFSNVTFSMSCDYELKNRMEDKDSRRILFNKQEELLGQLNESWRQREKAEHENILRINPFDDLAGLRATFSEQLRQKGFAETEINNLAMEKYPKS